MSPKKGHPGEGGSLGYYLMSNMSDEIYVISQEKGTSVTVVISKEDNEMVKSWRSLLFKNLKVIRSVWDEIAERYGTRNFAHIPEEAQVEILKQAEALIRDSSIT